MKSNTIFLSIINLFVTIVLFALGLFFVMLRWFPKINENLATVLLYEPQSFFYYGLFFLLFSLALMLTLYSIYKFKYFSITVLPCTCFVDPKIICSYVKEIAMDLFKDEELQIDVRVKRKKILEIILFFPTKIEIEDEAILTLKRELHRMLQLYFAYDKKFILTFKFG